MPEQNESSSTNGEWVSDKEYWEYPAKAPASSTYRYRDAELRRLYMRNYMRGYMKKRRAKTETEDASD